ncbi:MAG: hypothetical protein H6511_01500 [Holophagales bacterium]|nr:hypothetical protein [Holophagales bacterium]
MHPRRATQLAPVLLIGMGLLPLGGARGAEAPTDCSPPVGWISSRPDATGPTRVEVGFYVNDINEISDAQQRFTTDALMDLSWTDPRLAPYAGCTVPRGTLWDPGLVLANRRSLSQLLPDRYTIGPGGRVRYLQRAYGDLSVRLDLHDFPFDRQSLEYVGVSTRYGPSELELVFRPDASGRRQDLLAAGWQIGDLDASTFSARMGNSPVELAGIRIGLPARRDATYFLWKFIAPLTLVVCMAWMVQWIDPSMAPSRIGLSATALLTVFAYQFSVASSLPRVSYATRMDRFFLGAIGIVLLGLVLSVLASELFRRERHEEARRLTRHGRWLLPAIYAAVTLAAFAV